jgi:hypothetical protein
VIGDAGTAPVKRRPPQRIREGYSQGELKFTNRLASSREVLADPSEEVLTTIEVESFLELQGAIVVGEVDLLEKGLSTRRRLFSSLRTSPSYLSALAT